MRHLKLDLARGSRNAHIRRRGVDSCPAAFLRQKPLPVAPSASIARYCSKGGYMVSRLPLCTLFEHDGCLKSPRPCMHLYHCIYSSAAAPNNVEMRAVHEVALDRAFTRKGCRCLTRVIPFLRVSSANWSGEENRTPLTPGYYCCNTPAYPCRKPKGGIGCTTGECKDGVRWYNRHCIVTTT